MNETVGIIGLGIMGGGMAEALIKAGYCVYGHDLLPQARERLKEAGGRPLASPAAVAAKTEVMITSLPSVAALQEVVARLTAGGGKKAATAKGRKIVIETSTLPVADKIEALKRLESAGISLLDCPISGTAVRIKDRAWTIFVSGKAADCKKVAPIFEVFTPNAPYVGAFGCGSQMKFIANHLVAIHNVAVGETMTFARRMGLDPEQVWNLFATSPVVGSGVFKLRGKLMVERRYRPATMKISVWQKDMQVIGEMAKSVACPLPLFSACAPLYTAALAQGFGEADTASVCEVIATMAGDAGGGRGTD